jgi:hypothetical protein
VSEKLGREYFIEYQVSVMLSMEQIGWLDCLLGAFQEEHNWKKDVDKEATREMLDTCDLVIKRLDRELLKVSPVELPSEEFSPGEEELPL